MTRNAAAHTIADQFPLATLKNAARGVSQRAGFAPVLSQPKLRVVGVTRRSDRASAIQDAIDREGRNMLLILSQEGGPDLPMEGATLKTKAVTATGTQAGRGKETSPA